jgi:CheY-like chemotaxis protein
MREPEAESKRQAALRRYEILDTPPDAAFDDLATLCATVCDAPAAFIGCLDHDRVWLKARCGVDADAIGREWVPTPAASSTIGDLSADARFVGHPYVSGEAHWRFMASAPVAADDGSAIGVIAIVDTRRRRLSDLQRATLDILARQAAALFELHRLRQNAKPPASSENLADAAGTGSTKSTEARPTPPDTQADAARGARAANDDSSVEEAAIRRRILVVDDVEAAAATLGRVLEAMGHETRIAHDGPKALAIAKEYRPDVILLDLGMPGMSGFVVARLLRAQTGLDGMTLIAVTGHGRDEDRRQALEAGFDHHLLKPVSADHMRVLLDQLPRRG